MAVLALTRAGACAVRKAEQEKLAMNLMLLPTICGCTCCGDAEERRRMMGEITRSEIIISRLSDAITDWTGVCAYDWVR